MAARRSSRGGGSLQDLGGGRWRSQGIDPTGKRRSTIHHATTKREAVEAHQRFMVRLGNGAPGPSPRTVNDLLDAYLEHKKPGLAPTTFWRYTNRTKHVRDAIGKVKLDKVTPYLLDEFYRSPAVTPHAAQGIAYTILGPAFKQAHRWGWIASNPAKDASPPSSIKRQMNPPAHDEVLALTAALLRDGPEWLGVFVHLLAVTGARKGEVLGLRWDDIDWQAGAISIRRNVARTPALGVFTKEPKTARGRRTVAVGEGTVALLDAYWQRAGGSDTPWLFPGDPLAGDLPLSPAILDKAWQKAQRKHGITWRMHDIRHMVATTALSGGANLRAVADFLGHARPEVTLGVYAHALPRDHQVIAGLLAPPTSAST